MKEIASILRQFGFEVSEEKEKLADDIEQHLSIVLARCNQDRLQLALLCGCLCKVRGLRPSKIQHYLEDRLPEFRSDLRWISRVTKAGALWLDYPQIQDQSIDRTCTLSRLPESMREKVFNSGRLPNGLEFRSLNREELVMAVNEVLESRSSPSIESVERKMKREITLLTNKIGVVLDELSGVEGFNEISELIETFYKQLVDKLVKTGPRVRETIYVRSEDNVSRAVTA